MESITSEDEICETCGRYYEDCETCDCCPNDAKCKVLCDNMESFHTQMSNAINTQSAIFPNDEFGEWTLENYEEFFEYIKQGYVIQRDYDCKFIINPEWEGDDLYEEEEELHICGETGGYQDGGCGEKFDYQDTNMIGNTSFCLACYEKIEEEEEVPKSRFKIKRKSQSPTPK